MLIANTEGVRKYVIGRGSLAIGKVALLYYLPSVLPALRFR